MLENLSKHLLVVSCLDFGAELRRQRFLDQRLDLAFQAGALAARPVSALAQVLLMTGNGFGQFGGACRLDGDGAQEGGNP